MIEPTLYALLQDAFGAGRDYEAAPDTSSDAAFRAWLEAHDNYMDFDAYMPKVDALGIFEHHGFVDPRAQIPIQPCATGPLTARDIEVTGVTVVVWRPKPSTDS